MLAIFLPLESFDLNRRNWSISKYINFWYCFALNTKVFASLNATNLKTIHYSIEQFDVL